MFIKSFYSKGYMPLKVLSNIDSININFENDLCLILGSNGSGKSSLLRILNPLPAIPADYDEDGQKTITILHNGSEYILTSIIKKGAKHTVTKDGVVIHSNVITSMQKEYVVNEFGLTPIVNRLLTGGLKFTDMKPVERKDIMTIISPLELDYSVLVHSTIKERLRDTVGALKHINNKVSETTTQLMELNIEESLLTEKESLENQISRLLPFTLAGSDNISFLEEQLVDCQNKIETIKSRLSKIDNRRAPIGSMTSLDDLIEYAGKLSGLISSKQAEIDKLTTKFNEFKELSEDLSDIDNTKLRVIEVNQLLEQSSHHDLLTNHDELISKLFFLSTNLNELWAWLDDFQLNSENDIEELNKNYDQIVLLFNKTKKDLIEVKSELEHLDNPNLYSVCPKCQFQFTSKGIGVNERRTMLLTRIKELEINEQKYESDLIKLNAIKQIQDKTDRGLKEIAFIYKSTEILTMFWSTVKDPKDLLVNKDVYSSAIHLLDLKIKQSKYHLELESELKLLNKVLESHAKFEGFGEDKLNTLELELSDKLTELNQLKIDLNYAQNLVKYIQFFNKQFEYYDEITIKVTGIVKELTKAKIKQDAKQRIRKLYEDLASITSIVKRYTDLTQLSKELESEQIVLQLKHKALIHLENQTKSLIAEQLAGFIDDYTSQINNILETIWEYAIEVQMCDFQDNQLTYSFPMIINGTTVDEISIGSTAQKDIINFAFMLVMRQYLEMNQYPLFLDELGSTFDTKHQKNFLNYIKEMQAANLCSNVFFVSHYASVYGGLSNADVVVLDDRNITTNAQANANVIIEYLK